MPVRLHAVSCALDPATPDVARGPRAGAAPRLVLQLASAVSAPGARDAVTRAAEGETAEADSAVVARVLGGDVEAYALLVRRYHARCLRYAERVLGDRADADDVVQEAFIRAYDALGRYEERARFRAWLFAVLATECRAHARGRTRRTRFFVRDDAAARLAAAPESTTAPDAKARLDRALARLEPRLREAFLLRHVEELSYDEMRVVTGAGVSALKMRVKRACDALRALLDEP